MDAKTRDHEQINIIIEKAVAALRQRLGADAVRYLALRMGYPVDRLSELSYYPNGVDEFVQLAKLPAGSAEEFTMALTNASAQHAPHWYNDARAPLPGDLQVLTLEYQHLREPDEDSDGVDFATLFAALGLCSQHQPGEATRFGKADKTRFRVDAVMTARAYQSLHYDLDTMFDCARRGGLALVHHKTINNLAHRYEVGDEFLDWDWYDAVGSLRLNMISGGGDFEVDPERPGEFERWARTTAKRTDCWLTLHAACNGNIAEMLKVIKQEPAGEQQFAVEGLVPRSVTTLLLARKGVGKTNALLELAVAMAEHRATWWEFALRPGDGFVVFLLGEGSKEDATERVLMMNDGKWPMLLKVEKFSDSTMIEDIIASLKQSGIKVDLLIVDPGRKYYRGDEDSSDAVSDFFTKLEAFADQTNSALIISHHLKRGANPKTIHEVPNWVRGSQVWIDRPRVVLAMNRRGGETTFGIPVRDGDPLHNMRAATMFADVLKLRRDEDTFTHVPINASKKKPTNKQIVEEPVDGSANGSDDERVFATLRRLLEEGKRIGTSFNHELFSHKRKTKHGSSTWELGDMTRIEMRAAMQRLIDAGRVLRKASGALYLPRE